MSRYQENTRHKRMWFGTQHHSEWITCPLRGAEMSPESWGTEGTYLSGGGFVRQSQDSHRQYIFEWSGASSRASAEIMQAYRDGVYNKTPSDLIYFIDPLMYSRNILPKRWAQPGILTVEGSAEHSPLGVVAPIDTPPSVHGNQRVPLVGAQVSSPLTSLSDLHALTGPGVGAVWIPVPEGKALTVIAWTGDPIPSESGLYIKSQAIGGSWQSPEKVGKAGITVSGVKGFLLATVGFFNFYGARAVIGQGDNWAPLVDHFWEGMPHYSPSVETDDGGEVENVFPNPEFKGGVGVVTVWENLIPSPRPSYSVSRYATTSARGVRSGENYREVEITADVSGDTTVYRTNSSNGHEDFEAGEVYSGRVGVGNPNSYPVTVRAGFLRNTGTSVAYGPTRSGDVTIPSRGYEEIRVPPYEVDSLWTTIRLGLVAPSTGEIPAGTILHIYDGFTVTRGEECPHLIHGDMPYGERDPNLRGDWYSQRWSSPSRLVAPKVYGLSTEGGAKAIQTHEWGSGGASLLVTPGVEDPFGLEYAGNFPARVRELGLEEGPDKDFVIDNRVGSELPKLMVTCFHGGDFEQGALEMSVGVSDALGSTWWGIDTHVRPEKLPESTSPSWDALHLSSNNYGHQGLLDMLAECDYALSFHGSTDWRENITSPGAAPGVPYSFIGGTNIEFKNAIASALRSSGFLCDTNTDNFPSFPGINPNNIVHQTRSGSGVQIEMSNAQRRSFFVNGDFSRPNRENFTSVYFDYIAAIEAGVRDFLRGV